MKTKQSAIIIGAGIGGIVTAIYLAKNGYQVDIYEKNATPGGRAGQMIKQGYRFDMGATMLIMPGIYREIFQSLDIPLFEEKDIVPLDDLYNIYFDNNEVLTFTKDVHKMREQLEKMEPGSSKRAEEYVRKGYEIYELGMSRLVNRNFDSVFQFINFKNAGLLIKLKTYISNFRYAKKFFANQHLQMAYTFQNIYVGQSPFNSPALFSMVPAAELVEGSYFPKGGIFVITQKLIDAAQKQGVQFHYNSPVEKINIQQNKATGIRLNDGREIEANVLVANADLPYVYRSLLPDKKEAKRLDAKRYSCSAICFHWGVDKIYPQLAHHNVFLSDDFKEGLRSIFEDKSVNDRPSFYVHAPGRTDASAAPAGHDALTVVVGAAHFDQSIDQNWNELKRKTRIAVINRLKQLGMEDIEEHICCETCVLPRDWENVCNISKGAVFGSLAHNLTQMAYFRPANQHRKYKNLYFAGGSTHPGNGIPNVMLSAKLTSERILKKKLTTENV